MMMTGIKMPLYILEDNSIVFSHYLQFKKFKSTSRINVTCVTQIPEERFNDSGNAMKFHRYLPPIQTSIA